MPLLTPQIAPACTGGMGIPEIRNSPSLFLSYQNKQILSIQWNPFCEATLFASEKWPFKRGGLLTGVEINTFMFRFTLSSGLSRGAGLSSGWPLVRVASQKGFHCRSYRFEIFLQSYMLNHHHV